MAASSRNIIWRVLDLIVGGLFIYAGVLKALDPIRFAGDIDNYHMLPWMLSVRLSFYLPWLEVFCGLALVLRRFYAGALAILMALIVIFIGANVVAKMRGLDVKCGCFGHISDNLGFASHMALNLAILVGIALLMRRTKAAAA
jgi:putative oxidoreductase